jgi:hypothetical protein
MNWDSSWAGRIGPFSLATVRHQGELTEFGKYEPSRACDVYLAVRLYQRPKIPALEIFQAEIINAFQSQDSTNTNFGQHM